MARWLPDFNVQLDTDFYESAGRAVFVYLTIALTLVLDAESSGMNFKLA